MAVLQTPSRRYDSNDVARNRNVTRVRPDDLYMYVHVQYQPMNRNRLVIEGSRLHSVTVHKYSFGYARLIIIPL